MGASTRAKARPAASPMLLVTPGEPAGIGPDLVLALARQQWPLRWAAVADPGLLRMRAELLGLDIRIRELADAEPPLRARSGELWVRPVALAVSSAPGRLDPRNAGYVLACLRAAVDEVVRHPRAALVTGPVQKSVINDAGIPFTGHTEFLAERTAAPLPVMLLVAGSLRVALATTHLPLHAVPAAITQASLQQVLQILVHDLRTRFGIEQPRILVCGLNPHAGESGHLGREEIDIITPVLERLRNEGLQLAGPLPADTLFTPARLCDADAVLAMYHDQGLPVLKYAGFGRAVNVTLGLPIVRTSVDHGTALDLAGSGQADAGSLRAAMRLAIQLLRLRGLGLRPPADA
jgi:4-hydroxythreonine-4-phosphate dehydrogenase